jgi:hypothetical protein
VGDAFNLEIDGRAHAEKKVRRALFDHGAQEAEYFHCESRDVRPFL